MLHSQSLNMKNTKEHEYELENSLIALENLIVRLSVIFLLPLPAFFLAASVLSASFPFLSFSSSVLSSLIFLW